MIGFLVIPSSHAPRLPASIVVGRTVWRREWSRHRAPREGAARIGCWGGPQPKQFWDLTVYRFPLYGLSLLRRTYRQSRKPSAARIRIQENTFAFAASFKRISETSLDVNRRLICSFKGELPIEQNKLKCRKCRGRGMREPGRREPVLLEPLVRRRMRTRVQ